MTRKLQYSQAEAIRWDTRTLRAIASDYGVSRTTVMRIKRGDIYTSAISKPGRKPKAQD